MESLFDEGTRQARERVAPLAVRMRPRNLDEFVGQADSVGAGTWLNMAIRADTLSSVILYGPSGTGKTTLARIIAKETAAEFVEVSAITGGVAELRKVMDAAEQRLALTGQRTILFIDEIHRFNRAQQDALLHAVEDRVIALVGATTENPFFEVNSALISRSRVVELHPLADGDIREVVERALVDERGFGGSVTLDAESLDAIVLTAGGDARVALTTLELATSFARGHASESSEAIHISLDDIGMAVPTRTLPYDKDRDVHYDVISAFIKSMRGSDPDATLYWLARMIEGGEDPRFIARRIFIAASEDVGNADPHALLVAQAAFKAAESIGYPECRIALAQAAVYNALAPKSNAAYMGIDAALHEVRTGPARAVPNPLRDRHRPGAEGYGPYLYPHSYQDAVVEQQYLPEGLERGSFFTPTKRGWEGLRAQHPPYGGARDDPGAPRS